VLIQFGHNDAHGPGKPESTDAATDYRDNLRRMVDEAIAAGAKPVLISPVQRRQWDGPGRLNASLSAYATAVLAVASEKQVAVVDLYKRSSEEYLKMGKAGTDAWSPAPPKDVSHFNQDGARAVASWVAEALPAEYPHGSNPAAAPRAPQGGGTAEKPAGH
jgi:lysophospholipase L1-like esterase